MDQIRVTASVAIVLRIFLDSATEPRYGYELMRLTGFPSGKLYPLLARLQAAGWVTKEREQISAAQAGRPVRRLYRLTPEGVRAARLEVAALSAKLQPSASRGSAHPVAGTA